MIKIISILFSCSLLAVEPWTKTDTIFFLSYVASEMVDWTQTSRIHRYPSLKESNPELGPYPDQGQINRHFAKHIAMDLAIASCLRLTLPAKYSRWFLGISTACEIRCIVINHNNGIRISGGFYF